MPRKSSYWENPVVESKRKQTLQDYRDLLLDKNVAKPVSGHTEYQSLWLNRYGHVKMRVTRTCPRVQIWRNQKGKGNRDNYYMSGDYKNAELHDMDAYGWILISLTCHQTLFERKRMSVFYINDLGYTESDYKSLIDARKGIKKNRKSEK